MADIVPFGKYKNQPVEALAQDKDYCEWLKGQNWVAQRFPEIHTVIINNFAEPSETPEHNALQLRFLDEGLRAKVALLVMLTQRPYAQHFKEQHYIPFLKTCGAPIFEQQAMDVLWEVRQWYPRYDENLRYTLSGTDLSTRQYRWSYDRFFIAVECKPSLGDDYPAVLRFMHSLPPGQDYRPIYKVVVMEHYAFRGGTIQQVQALFQSSGVLLLDLAGIEALPMVTCIAEADLPSALAYYQG